MNSEIKEMLEKAVNAGEYKRIVVENYNGGAGNITIYKLIHSTTNYYEFETGKIILSPGATIGCKATTRVSEIVHVIEGCIGYNSKVYKPGEFFVVKGQQQQFYTNLHIGESVIKYAKTIRT